MEHNFKFYYVANSCLLIQNGSTKILIDGPYNSENDFDPLDEKTVDDMVFAKGIFSGLDGILFTHGHEDHFDYGKMERCLANNNHLTVAAPADCFPRERSSIVDLAVEQNKCIKFIGNKGHFKIKDVEIHYYRTKHMVVDREAEIDHYAFVIEYGKHRVFVSGDLEMDDEITEALCNHGLYDAVFVNPVIPQKKPWFENLMKINASMRYVYHLPSEENDRFFYRKAAMRMAKKHGKYKLLLDKMKKLNS